MDHKSKSKKQLIKELEQLNELKLKLKEKQKQLKKDLKKIKDENDTYRLYFKNSKNPILITEKNTGRIIDANNAAINLYGYKLNEFLKISIKEVNAKSESVKKKYQQIKTSTSIAFHVKKDGTIFPAEISEAKVNAENGVVNILTIKDASKNIPNKIKQLNQINFLREVINSSPNYIFVTDAKGKFVLTNKNWSRNLRYSPEEIIGKTVYDLFPRDIAHLMNKDDMEILDDKKNRIEREEKYVDAEGNIRWLYTIKLPMKNDKGKTKYIIGISVDINELKEAEKALKEREQNYRSLMESSLDPIYVFQENKLILVNPAWEKLFGFSSDEVASEGFSIMNIVGPESKKTILKRLKKRMNNQPISSRYEMQGLTKDGRLIDLEVSVSEIMWNGKYAIQGIYRDITERKRTEEALRREAFIFDNLYDAVIITDLEGNILNWNASATKLYGYNKDEILNQPSEILNKNNLHATLTEQIIETVKNEGKWTGEINFVRKDGTNGISETVVFPFNDAKGERIALIGVNRDTTERKKAEEALRESENKFRHIAEHSLVGVYLIQDGLFKYVNPKLAEIFGYTVEEMIDKKGPVDVTEPESFKIVNENINKRLKGEIPSIHYEFLGLTIDKRIIEVEVYGSMSIYKGKPAVIGTLLDITERKEFEEQLRKLSRAVEQSPSAIVITNISGNIEYVNPRFTELTGYSFNEINGKNPRFLKSGHTSDIEYKNLWETVTKGKNWRGEFQNKRKSGEYYWVSASISPIKNSTGKITHFLAIEEDITEKKKIESELIRAKEKAEESDRLKSEFLAQMSHEIRSPINIILSYNSFLRDELAGKLESQFESSFESIDSSGKRLLRTIDLILNMAALQSGYIEFQPEPINLMQILEGLLKEFEYSAKRKSIDISVNNYAGDFVVLADEYIVSEIFQNLIGNAIKFTDNGKIDIDLSDVDGKKLKVDVKDTGIGISQEYLPKLFDPFSQEDSGYSRRFEGNGLGLALVKKYIELIDAEIRVESKKGIGSVFTVIFNKSEN